MYKAFVITISKLVYHVSILLGKNASALPGSIAYKFDHHILDKIKYPKICIAVTGSSGKGSTTKLINHTLSKAGYKVSYNKFGSNGIFGIMTLVLTNCNILGKVKCDILLMEIDERHIKLAFPNPPFSHLIVTNITRDQPARNAEPEIIYNELFSTINSNKTTLIINADDPIVNRIKTTYKGKIITYGISNTNNSYTNKNNLSIDASYCPVCNSKLEYTFYHYGHIGNYRCPNCDFKRGKIDYEATNINLNKQEFICHNDLIKINKNILFAVYYTLATYTLCNELKIQKNILLDSLNIHMTTPKGLNTYKIDDRTINILESKNENNLSYHQSIQYILDEKGTKTVIMGFDNVSRRYKYNDLSWLFDVPFEMLNNSSIDSILCIGKYKYDVATRLEYAGIKKNKIIIVDDINHIFTNYIHNTKGNIYTMVCFDLTDKITSLLKGIN